MFSILGIVIDLIVIFQCVKYFPNSKVTCTTVGDTDKAGGYACMGADGIWEISVLSPQFCYEPKAALKKIKS